MGRLDYLLHVSNLVYGTKKELIRKTYWRRHDRVVKFLQSGFTPQMRTNGKSSKM